MRGKFYPKKVIQKKLSKNKSRKKFYPEVLSKMYVTYSTSLYNNSKTTDFKYIYATYSTLLYTNNFTT